MTLITPEYREWAKTVKKLLIDKDMNTSGLAKEISADVSAVCSTLSCVRPNHTIVEKISQYLGIDLSEYENKDTD